MLIIALLSYAAAMMLANLTVFAAVSSSPSLIPLVTGVNALILIGLDLALRDWLHTKLTRIQMGGLIVGASMLTFLFNPAAHQIASASAISFAAAAVADWAVFSRLSGYWNRRHSSNVAGAAVDSLLFPTLAFGSLMPGVVIVQFAMKVVGGAIWTFLLSRRKDSVAESQ